MTTVRFCVHLLQSMTSQCDRESSSELLPVSTYNGLMFSEHMPLFWKTIDFKTTGNSGAENNHEIYTRNTPS